MLSGPGTAPLRTLARWFDAPDRRVVAHRLLIRRRLMAMVAIGLMTLHLKAVSTLAAASQLGWFGGPNGAVCAPVLVASDSGPASSPRPGCQELLVSLVDGLYWWQPLLIVVLLLVLNRTKPTGVPGTGTSDSFQPEIPGLFRPVSVLPMWTWPRRRAALLPRAGVLT